MKENLWPIRASLNHHHSSASSSCNNLFSNQLLLITSTHPYPLLLRSSLHVLHHHCRVLSSIPTTTTPTFVPSRGVNGGRFVSRTAPRDHYQVLGVPRTATQAEIKKAFYTLSKKYHPDVVGSNEASAKKFLEVKEAYDTLKDEQKRKEYDLRNPPPGARRQASSNDYHSYDYWQQRMAEQERVRQQQQYGSAGSQSSSSSDGWNQDWKRVWERMQQDQDFRRAAEDLNERLRRMREQQFYQQQAKRTTAGGGNPQDPSEQPAPSPTPGWPGSAGMIRLIQRVILVYILVSLFIALLRPNRAADHSQMQPPRNWQEWEQRRRIEEMMRKMPWDEKPK